MRDVSIIQTPKYQREMVYETAGAVVTSIENSYSINQSVEVEINNDFNGERDLQVRSYDAMSKATDDISDVLSRALDYLR